MAQSEGRRESAVRGGRRNRKGRAGRRGTYRLAVQLAEETAGLPEPVQAGVIALVRALIGWARHAWHELAGGAADDGPGPGDRSGEGMR